MSEILLYPEAIERLQKDLKRAIRDWDYLSGVSGDGPIVEFEEEFAKINESKYAIALTNATSALFVALMASGIGKGDEVILPSYTWPQTLTPVILTGATPVFADVDRNTVTISPESVKRLITRRTRAIIAVHLYGIPANVLSLDKIAKENGCILIYDSAQGFGAYFNSKPIGAYGDYVAYSLGRSKLFSVGEGGILICRKREYYERAIAFSQHPLRMHRDVDSVDIRRLIDGVSMNFRIHPLIASLALGQLKGFINTGKLEKHQAIFKELYERIKLTGGRDMLPEIPEGASPSGVCLPLFPKRHSDLSKNKDVFEKHGLNLFEGGIKTPLHLSNTIQRHRFIFHSQSSNFIIPWHKTHKYGSCPNTENLCKTLKQAFISIRE